MSTTTEKKIVIRKAPTEKANTYDEGYIATGTDDNEYIVTADKKGFKRWMKVKKETVAPEEPKEKPKRTYKKKSKPEPIEEEIKTDEEETPVEEEPKEKPKRTYMKKPKTGYETPVEEDTKTDDEEPKEKPKRIYKKKELKTCEQGTQTDDEVVPKAKKGIKKNL